LKIEDFLEKLFNQLTLVSFGHLWGINFSYMPAYQQIMAFKAKLTHMAVTK